MNKKQNIILGLGVLGLILIVLFTPRYKIAWIDSKNFIQTEQSSSLYKRSKGDVKLHWDKILIYAGITVSLCGILMFIVRRKGGKNNI
jgi:hypothetical protein